MWKVGLSAWAKAFRCSQLRGGTTDTETDRQRGDLYNMRREREYMDRRGRSEHVNTGKSGLCALVELTTSSSWKVMVVRPGPVPCLLLAHGGMSARIRFSKTGWSEAFVKLDSG